MGEADGDGWQWGDAANGQPKPKRAKVVPTQAAIELAERQVTATPGLQKSAIFDPLYSKAVSQRIASDAIWNAIHFKWRDTQQLGRLAVDAMLQHAAVSTPHDFLTAFLKCYSCSYVPQGRNPTERQKMLAEFMNDQIGRLPMSGDPRQGWTRVMDWFAQGLRYGFTLAEVIPAIAPWGEKSQRLVQVERLVALPQATLDAGYVPLEEFGQSLLAGTGDRRYRCFDISDKGDIDAYVQFNGFSDQDRIEWRTPQDRLRILHFIHRGGESSPYGQPLSFAAYRHWSSLYTIELMEEAALEAARSILFVSYRTPDGVPSPELHAKVVEAIQNGGPVMVVPNGDAKAVSPFNKEFTDHITQKKKELRKYITQSMMVPTSLYSETEDSQSDGKALMANSFKRVYPSFLLEFSDVMTWQFGRRLIDANWSRVNPEDYPVLKFNIMLDEDIKAATAILQQALPHVASDKLGEFLSFMMPGGFDPDWIASTHAKSVSQMRPLEAADAPAGSPQAQSFTNPGKPAGTPDDDRAV